jgi:hypothetical protein
VKFYVDKIVDRCNEDLEKEIFRNIESYNLEMTNNQSSNLQQFCVRLNNIEAVRTHLDEFATNLAKYHNEYSQMPQMAVPLSQSMDVADSVDVPIDDALIM